MFLLVITLTGAILNIPRQCELNYCSYTEPPAVEKQIERLENKKRTWAKGCEWTFNGCRQNNFDCSGIISASLRKFMGYNWKKLNSERIAELWQKIKYNQVSRWDYVYFEAHGEEMNHTAIILESDWKGGVVILDGVSKPWSMTKRFVRLGNNKTHYLYPIRWRNAGN